MRVRTSALSLYTSPPWPLLPTDFRSDQRKSSVCLEEIEQCVSWVHLADGQLMSIFPYSYKVITQKNRNMSKFDENTTPF